MQVLNASIVLAVVLCAALPLRAAEIVVRVTDRDRIELEGGWKIGQDFAERQGTARKSITYRLPVEKEGRYVLWLYTHGRPHVWQTRTPIRVQHAQGVFSGTVNIAMGIEGWKPIGEFAFKPGAEASVRLEDAGGSRRVSFGAVRLTPATPSGFAAPPLPDPATAKNPIERQIFHHLRTLAGANIRNADDPAMTDALRQQALDAAMAFHSLNRDPDRGALWYDNRHGSDEARRAWDGAARIAQMLAGYYSPHVPDSLGIRGNPQVVADAKAAMTWITTELYNESLAPNGAFWFQQQVGAPGAINECLVLLYPHVDQAFIDSQLKGSLKHFEDPRTSFYGVTSGANRVFMCRVGAVRGMLRGDEAEIRTARDAALEVFQYRVPGERSRDGFYPDGTFIQHGRIVYNWGYGNGLYNSFVALYESLDGSPWAYGPEDTRLLGDFYLRGMSPMVNFANQFPGSMGRAFGRSQNPPPHVGSIPGVAGNMYYMAPPDLREPILATIHQHYREAESLGLAAQFRRGNINEMDRLITALRTQPSKVEPVSFSRVYHHGDAMIHRRDDFVFGVVMSSSRIADHECIWGNNQNGWYQGHGMNWILDAGDPLKYAKEYRPTVDPYRLPGITVDKRQRPPGSQAGGNSGKSNSRDWVGGVSLGDLASGVGMEIEIVEADGTVVPLSGRKSWFAFDRKIIALGSGITCTSPYPVETIIENARVDSHQARIVIDGQEANLTVDEAKKLDNVRWMHLQGNAASKGLGIVFPEPSSVMVLRANRTGSWADVQAKADETPHTRPFVTVYYDHGVGPHDGGYAYVLHPATDAAATAAAAKNLAVRIVAHTPAIHAVHDAGLGLLGVNFFEPGATEGVSVDQPCAVLLHREGDLLRVAVSDPTQKLDQPILLRLEVAAGAGVGVMDEGIKVVELNPLTLRIDPTGSAGRTFRASFKQVLR